MGPGLKLHSHWPNPVTILIIFLLHNVNSHSICRFQRREKVYREGGKREEGNMAWKRCLAVVAGQSSVRMAKTVVKELAGGETVGALVDGLKKKLLCCCCCSHVEWRRGAGCLGWLDRLPRWWLTVALMEEVQRQNTKKKP